MKKLIFLLALFISSSIWAQTVSCEISQESVLIGKPAAITYTCRMEKRSVFRFTPEKGPMPSRKKSAGSELTYERSENIEQLFPFRDTVFTKGNEKYWRGTYTVTGWDEGIYLIEGQTILVDDSTISMPPVTLKINLVETKKGIDIYDIEENFAAMPDPENSVIYFLKEFWWLIFLLLLIIGYFIYKKWQKNRLYGVPEIPERSLRERTLLAVELLEKERMWEIGKLKEHYIELSFILRSYLSSRYDLNLLENTTAEAQLILSHKGLHPETIRVIGTVLDQSDMVKFARSAPIEVEVLKVSQQVRQIVAETSPIEFEHEQ
jgi:hypothetical protein